MWHKCFIGYYDKAQRLMFVVRLKRHDIAAGNPWVIWNMACITHITPVCCIFRIEIDYGTQFHHIRFLSVFPHFLWNYLLASCHEVFMVHCCEWRKIPWGYFQTQVGKKLRIKWNNYISLQYHFTHIDTVGLLK